MKTRGYVGMPSSIGTLGVIDDITDSSHGYKLHNPVRLSSIECHKRKVTNSFMSNQVKKNLD